MMRHKPIRRVAVVATVMTLAAMTVLIGPAIVLAHAELVTPTPADKSTVTVPVAEVSGIYSEAMKPDGSSLVVKAADGSQVAKGAVDPTNTQRMVATPDAPLGNGNYTVLSTTLAEDGDIEHATWTFTVAIAASASPAAVPSAVATTASGAAPTTVSATPAPAPSPSGVGSTTGSGSDVVLPIIVALIALGAGAVYLLTRRNRPTDQA